MKAVNWARDVYQRLVHIEDKEGLILETLRRGVEKSDYTKSYSQHGEDVLIWQLFTDMIGMKRFTYMDIGAHHPFLTSNTALFYEKGCVGINVEANPMLIENFYRERKHDVNLCCGVGAEEGEMTFYMLDDHSGRNSFDRELLDRFIQKNPEARIQKTMQIKVITIQEIVERYWKGIMPDYMDIDIEGLEYDALCGLDFSRYAPKVITYEVNRDNPLSKDKMDGLMKENGYVFYVKTGTNYTWIRQEYSKYII